MSIQETASPIREEILQILRCPVTHQPLRRATAEELARFPELSEALVCQDGSRLYPVREGIPLLLAEKAMALS